jgi:hypothetical protein
MLLRRREICELGIDGGLASVLDDDPEAPRGDGALVCDQHAEVDQDALLTALWPLQGSFFLTFLEAIEAERLQTSGSTTGRHVRRER